MLQTAEQNRKDTVDSGDHEYWTLYADVCRAKLSGVTRIDELAERRFT